MHERLLILYARRFPVRRGKLRVVNALWRSAAGDRGTLRLASLRHGGMKIACDLAEMLHRQYYFFGTYFLEEDILECWEIAANGARVILDVGANAGIFSLAALAVQRDAVVHAFEPTPELAAGLRETAALNGLDGLYVHEAAVSDQAGRATLVRFRGENGENEGMNFTRTPQSDEEELVPAVCLDSFCEEHGIDHIDLLKLDIQGNEYKALTGAVRLISTGGIGTVFLELNWCADFAACPARQSIRLLEGAGYKFSVPGKHLRWAHSGEWLRPLSDIVARRV